jgi:hypothetical protein
LDENEFDLNQLKPIKSGAMGTVYKYIWKNKPVAIKRAIGDVLEAEIDMLRFVE